MLADMSEKKAEQLFYAAWATAWGPAGAVMGPAGLKRFVLPHYQMKDLLDLLAWEHPGAVRDEKPFEPLIQLSRDYFNGKVTDFSAIACDMPSEKAFAGVVLRACREIPYGQKRNYLKLAETISRPDAARAVAAALGKNAIPLVIPCHRVIYADGRAGGFSAEGGTAIKLRMLEMEAKAAGGLALV